MDTDALAGELDSLVETSESLLNMSLFNIAGTPISIMTLAMAGIIVVMTFWISKMMRRGLERGFRARGITDAGTVGLVGRLTHYTVLLVGLGVALQTVGIDLGALFAAGAVFAVGVGFAMQNIAQNFVSGLILLIERSIRPGDVLLVAGEVVRVEDMGIRSTLVRTRDGEAIIVPNSNLVADAVRNFSLGESLFRVRANVGVTYDSDMALVRRTVEAAIADLDYASKKRAPVVQMTGFGDNSVNFAVRIWIDDPWDQINRLSALHETLWWALKEAGVVIAFPQLDVHFDAPVAEGLARLKAAG
jgi:small-conductance mechanosensitive channel